MRILKIKFIGLLFLGFANLARAQDPLPLVITTREYPHVKSIQNGSIAIPECRISFSTMSAKELVRHLDVGSAGDVIEVDFVSYLKRFSSESAHDWILIPVFPWREFVQRHVIQKGPKLAVDVTNKTVLTWAKGILASSPTCKPLDKWESSISTVSSKSPLFPDYKPIEQAYFSHTRIFPIITVLAVRKELVEANAWLPEAIFIAFSEAKSQALKAGIIPWPWGEENKEKTIELMKKNYWSYGVQNNPKSLEALFKFAHEQGITSKELEPDEVFSPETIQLIDEKGAKN